MAKHTAIWRKQTSKEDFEAALHYLSLQLPTANAQKLVSEATHSSPLGEKLR